VTRTLFEAFLPAAWILSYIWLWEDRVPFAPILLGAGFLALVAPAHRRHGEGLREIGLVAAEAGAGPGRIRAALPRLALYTLPVIALALLPPLLGAVEWPGAGRTVRRIAVAIPWALFQQYGLCIVLYRRLSGALPARGALALATLVFAIFHLPNPALTALAGLGGIAWLDLYRRAGTLYPSTLSHAAVEVALLTGLAPLAPGIMNVGWRYLRHGGGI
jgi:membrane protease YdiL (CAAX protease family)